jgi:CheY-like chemotaxis protein
MLGSLPEVGRNIREVGSPVEIRLPDTRKQNPMDIQMPSIDGISVLNYIKISLQRHLLICHLS